MTTCDKIRPRLTTYLDGELADDHGSVVRGHLRECADCRGVARDEAALRDGLRLLPPVDPPGSLWAGVHARLAAAEVADARKPRWRRTAEHWARWARTARFTPTMPQLAAASVFAAAAIALLTVRAHRADEVATPAVALPDGPREQLLRPSPSTARDRPEAEALATVDVTADLLAEPARTTESYDRVVGELMTSAHASRAGWSAEFRAAFDARVAGLRGEIERAGRGRQAQRLQGSLIAYLQHAIIGDGMMLASGGSQ